MRDSSLKIPGIINVIHDKGLITFPFRVSRSNGIAFGDSSRDSAPASAPFLLIDNRGIQSIWASYEQGCTLRGI